MNDLIQYAPIKVGDVVEVGEFFWIPDESIIGWDRDARHGNGDAKSGGSVDKGCALTVRHVSDGIAVVRLDRPAMPYGAPASIGTVFEISVERMMRWPDMIEKDAEREKARKKKAAIFCR